MSAVIPVDVTDLSTSEGLIKRPPARAGRHPAGLVFLFATEMWDRFCYFGLRSILVFYLTRQVGLGDAEAVAIFSGFAALSGLSIVLGGYLSDHVISARRTVLSGAAVMIAGCSLLAFSSVVATRSGTPTFGILAGLALISIGTGPLKSGATTMLSQLYASDDPRRDAGFSFYYVGINLGAGVAAVACGFVGERVGWAAGFGLAGVGMVIGLFVFEAGRQHYAVERRAEQPGRSILIIVGAALVSVALFQIAGALQIGIAVVSLVFVVATYWRSRRSRSKSEMIAIHLIYLTVLAGIVYWTLFSLTGSAINLFLDTYAVRRFMGAIVPPSALQGLEPLFAIGLGPLVAFAIGRLAPKTTFTGRFAFGLALTTSAYVLLASAVALGTPIALGVTVAYFLLLTLGDLVVAPTILSNLSRIAPGNFVGTSIGLWYLSSTFGQLVGGAATNSFIGDSRSAAGASAPATLFLHLFVTLALIGGATAVAVVLSSRRYRHLRESEQAVSHLGRGSRP